MQYNIIKIFKRILSYLPARRRKQFLLLLGGMVIAAMIETAALGVIAFFVASVSDPKAIVKSSYIKYIQHFWNAGFLHNTQGVMAFLCVLVVSLVAGKNIIRGIITYANRRYSAFVSAYVGERMLTDFLYAPYEWHVSKNSADLTLSIVWRIFIVYLLGSSLQALSDIIVVAVLLVTLLVIAPVVSLIVIGFIGVSAFLIFSRIRIHLDRTLQKVKDYMKSINRDATKGIHGIKDVKIYGQERSFLSDYSSQAYIAAKLDALQYVLGQSPQWFLETIGFIMLTVTIYVMYFYINASTVRVTGTVALLAVTAWRVLPAVSKILNGLTQARSALPYVQNGLDYLSEVEHFSPAATSFKESGRNDFIFRESVRLEGVCFAYQGAGDMVLRDIDMVVEKGGTVGVIGVSGTGKSTLVDLLIGLLIPTRGRILIDGHILDHKISASWVKNIGYVAQVPYICDGTILENVAFGMENDEIERDHALECCEMAAMGDFLNDLPRGIDTPIGERGIKLSGGQRQRVAIARALYHDPEILIFDEATSSLDTQSEKAIQETIYSFKGKQTLVIIAHRLSTVAHCDKLIWLENGRMRKSGAPSDILPEYRLCLKEENPTRFQLTADNEVNQSNTVKL